MRTAVEEIEQCPLDPRGDACPLRYERNARVVILQRGHQPRREMYEDRHGAPVCRTDVLEIVAEGLFASPGRMMLKATLAPSASVHAIGRPSGVPGCASAHSSSSS